MSAEQLNESELALMFGFQVIEARERLNLSQQGAATLIGCSREYLSRVESGRAIKLSLFMARRIAIKLGITLDFFSPPRIVNDR